MNGVEKYLPDILIWSGVTGAIIQVVKVAAKDKIPDNFYPLLSLLMGIALGTLVLNWPILATILLGAVASGAYDMIKHTPIAIRDQVDKMKKE